MSGFLNFHRMAAMRGDGLHPKLAALLEERAAIVTDPKVVELRDPDFVQAGSGPASRTQGFVPGNVISFRPVADCDQARVRKTTSKSG